MLPDWPFPPAPAALALDITDATDAWLEGCENADVDINVASVAGVDVICTELVPEARFERDELGFPALEIEAITAEMLRIDDCDAVGSAKTEGDMVPDSEYWLLGLEDVVVEAIYIYSISI